MTARPLEHCLGDITANELIYGSELHLCYKGCPFTHTIWDKRSRSKLKRPAKHRLPGSRRPSQRSWLVTLTRDCERVNLDTKWAGCLSYSKETHQPTSMLHVLRFWPRLRQLWKARKCIRYGENDLRTSGRGHRKRVTAATVAVTTTEDAKPSRKPGQQWPGWDKGSTPYNPARRSTAQPVKRSVQDVTQWMPSWHTKKTPLRRRRFDGGSRETCLPDFRRTTEMPEPEFK
ncbi:hypothetical protein J6590_101070 [Homalodisca vitripennis]|nr:hypothetical protein J6590_101070 [Homalodisca vitripennis]